MSLIAETVAEVQPIVGLLEASGPYGALALVYFVLQKRTKSLEKVHERVILLAKEQTAAIVKTEAALRALRESVEGVAARLSK